MPSARLYYLRESRVLGAEGAIISRDNKIFADFTLPPGRNWRSHSCFLRARIPKIIELDGWFATLAWPEGRFFFHWMVECLPRFALLERFSHFLDGIFVPGPLQRFQVEALEALGISRERIVALNPQSHFAPGHLFVPACFAMYNPPAWMIRWYRRRFWPLLGGAHVSSPLKLFISRSDAPGRRLEGEDELWSYLSARGYIRVELGSLPLLEQLRLFYRASHVVAPHGAGLSNLVVGRPGLKVLEIMPPGWMAPCYFAICAVAGFEYQYVRGHRALASGKNANPQLDSYRVDMESVVRRFVEWE